MATAPHLLFTPVPQRARCDGWTAELQLRFVEALASGANPGEAARRVGKNRQNAYVLRKRPGAESFAAAWDRAVAQARRARSGASGERSRDRAMSSSLARAAAAEHGYRRVVSATSPDAARAAFENMLEALYGPPLSNSDKGDAGQARISRARLSTSSTCRADLSLFAEPS